jgi:hypothetical protein
MSVVSIKISDIAESLGVDINQGIPTAVFFPPGMRCISQETRNQSDSGVYGVYQG